MVDYGQLIDRTDMIDRFFSIVETMSTRIHSKDIKRSRKQNDL